MLCLLFIFAFFIFGLLFLYGGILDTFFIDRYKRFPKVEGELLDFGLSIGKPDQQGSVPSKGLLWKLEVKYRYVVNGKEYIGNKFSNIDKIKSMTYEKTDEVDPVTGEDIEPKPPKEIRDYMDTLKHMKHMPVYYNERAPSSSFIFFEESPFWRNFTLIFIGLMTSGSCLAGGILYYREHFT